MTAIEKLIHSADGSLVSDTPFFLRDGQKVRVTKTDHDRRLTVGDVGYIDARCIKDTESQQIASLESRRSSLGEYIYIRLHVTDHGYWGTSYIWTRGENSLEPIE